MTKNSSPKKGTRFPKLVPGRGSKSSQKLLITTAQTLKLLASDNTTKEIAQARKTTRRNINKLFKSYREKGYITQQRELTNSGKELIKKAVPFLPVVSNKTVPFSTVRLHDLQFSIKILKKPRDWDRHRTSITTLKKFHPRKWKAGGLFQEFIINNVRIRVTNKHVIILPPDIFEGTPEDAVNTGIKMVYQVIPQIENLFSITLEKDKYPNIKITRQHHAFIFHPLAKYCQKKGITLKIRDKSGALRVITDDSHGLCELETIHPVHAEDDAVKLQDHFEDIAIHDPLKPSEITKYLSEVTQNLSKLTKQINELGQGQINNANQLNSMADLLKLLLPQEMKGSEADKENQETLIGYR